MEEVHHTHKETPWGWLSALLERRTTGPDGQVKVERLVVTPWSLRSSHDWSA